MSMDGDQDSDGRLVEHIEIDGKMQPAPEGTNADLTIVEETLWKIQVTNGTFKKETETWKLTNLRAIRGNQYVMLKDCDDIVAVNIRKKLGGGNTGDVLFLKQGAPAITFTSVKDPYSLVEMANAANEKVLAMIKEVEERRATRPAGSSICKHCSRENPTTAKFCNQCGRPL